MATTVSELIITQIIQAHAALRQRVTAAVMRNRWATPHTDVQAPIPLDDIMWAVATDESILAQVKDALNAAEGDDQNNVDRALWASIDDETLTRVVIDIALPRLQ